MMRLIVAIMTGLLVLVIFACQLPIVIPAALASIGGDDRLLNAFHRWVRTWGERHQASKTGA